MAIGRALLASPKILLMDEPLASLDTERKLEILPLIEPLARRVRRSDRLCVPRRRGGRAAGRRAWWCWNNGHVVAMGDVEDVFGPGLSEAGVSRFAQSSVITGRLTGVDAEYDLTEIAHPAGTIWLTGRAGPVDARCASSSRRPTSRWPRPPAHNLSVRTTLTGTVAGIETGDGPLASVVISTLRATATSSRSLPARRSTSSDLPRRRSGVRLGEDGCAR